MTEHQIDPPPGDQEKKKSTAGRKPSEDPVKHMQLYIRTSEIKALGGDAKAKAWILAAIKKRTEEINKKKLLAKLRQADKKP